MSDPNIVEIEPIQAPHRVVRRDRSMEQLKKADLSTIMGSDALILATAVGKVVLEGLAWNEKRKMQRLVLYISGVTVSLLGLICLLMPFITKG